MWTSALTLIIDCGFKFKLAFLFSFDKCIVSSLTGVDYWIYSWSNLRWAWWHPKCVIHTLCSFSGVSKSLIVFLPTFAVWSVAAGSNLNLEDIVPWQSFSIHTYFLFILWKMIKCLITSKNDQVSIFWSFLAFNVCFVSNFDNSMPKVTLIQVLFFGGKPGAWCWVFITLTDFKIGDYFSRHLVQKTN